MGEFKVQVTDVSMVSPAETLPDHHSVLPFSTFDIMQKRGSMPYLQRVCFFPSSNSPSHNRCLIQAMKTSLAQLLVHFYPLAGRLSFPNPGARPEIDCNGAGVEFCVATADVDLSKLDYSQPQPWFSKLIQKGGYEHEGLSTNIPFLTIQVTEFKCGSVSLAWAYDHLFMDGSSQWYLMTSWSQLCRGLELSSPPTHNRDFEQHHPLFSDITPMASHRAYTFDDCSLGMEARIFDFDRSDINTLKSLAGATFSSFEVVASHVWITLCKARHLLPTQQTVHQLPVNCRSRLTDPLLPLTFFGNCVLCAFAQASAGELTTVDGLPFAAAVVHQAIRGFQAEEIRSQVADFNRAEGDNPFSKGVTGGVDTWGGSSPRFPMYELDFGWGKPAAVRHCRNLWNGFCFYDPSPRGGGGMEVTVFLPPHTMSEFTRLLYHFKIKL